LIKQQHGVLHLTVSHTQQPQAPPPQHRTQRGTGITTLSSRTRQRPWPQISSSRDHPAVVVTASRAQHTAAGHYSCCDHHPSTATARSQQLWDRQNPVAADRRCRRRCCWAGLWRHTAQPEPRQQACCARPACSQAPHQSPGVTRHSSCEGPGTAHSAHIVGSSLHDRRHGTAAGAAGAFTLEGSTQLQLKWPGDALHAPASCCCARDAGPGSCPQALAPLLRALLPCRTHVWIASRACSTLCTHPPLARARIRTPTG
jgi:hypothetical protein